MEALGDIMRKNLGAMACSSMLKSCSKCGDPIEKEIEICNKIRRVSVICSCKKEILEEKRKIEELREKKERLRRGFKNSLMDKSFYDKTFENWDFNKGNIKFHNMGTKYVDNFSKIKDRGLGLLIYGGVGSGKSYLSFSIANGLLQDYRSVICLSINGLLDRIRETYNKWGNEGEYEVIKSLTNAELLIIDDLGVEKNTEWSISKIYDIVDNRYRNKLPIIITTNHSIDNLKDKYGERTMDRLSEICVQVEYRGRSLRREEGKENVQILRELLREDYENEE